MPYAIRITVGQLVLDAELNDTAIARNAYRALPVASTVSRWGDEIYFTMRTTADEEDPMRTEMEIGELAFWPPGQAFCIFWGPTPASQGNKPAAISPVVPIGKIVSDLTGLDGVPDGDTIRVEPCL